MVRERVLKKAAPPRLDRALASMPDIGFDL
jgi:hypothetical protein